MISVIYIQEQYRNTKIYTYIKNKSECTCVLWKTLKKLVILNQSVCKYIVSNVVTIIFIKNVLLK